MRNKIYLTALCLSMLCCNTPAMAQKEKSWEYELRSGVNVGGTTPFPLPAEIRKINSYKPGINPALGIRATRWIDKNKEWGITVGIAVEYKGFKESAEVKYWHTNLVVGERETAGNFSGVFSGKNETHIKNGYFTFPIMLSYHPFKRWIFNTGGYFSWMHTSNFKGSASDGYIRKGTSTGEKIDIKNASFNFSEHLKWYDIGLIVGTNWHFRGKWYVTTELTWGLTPVFPTNFKGISHKMYNIYMSAGLAYTL